MLCLYSTVELYIDSHILGASGVAGSEPEAVGDFTIGTGLVLVSACVTAVSVSLSCALR